MLYVQIHGNMLVMIVDSRAATTQHINLAKRSIDGETRPAPDVVHFVQRTPGLA